MPRDPVARNVIRRRNDHGTPPLPVPPGTLRLSHDGRAVAKLWKRNRGLPWALLAKGTVPQGPVRQAASRRARGNEMSIFGNMMSKIFGTGHAQAAAPAGNAAPTAPTAGGAPAAGTAS